MASMEGTAGEAKPCWGAGRVLWARLCAPPLFLLTPPYPESPCGLSSGPSTQGVASWPGVLGVRSRGGGWGGLRLAPIRTRPLV